MLRKHNLKLIYLIPRLHLGITQLFSVRNLAYTESTAKYRDIPELFLIKRSRELFRQSMLYTVRMLT